MTIFYHESTLLKHKKGLTGQGERHGITQKIVRIGFDHKNIIRQDLQDKQDYF